MPTIMGLQFGAEFGSVSLKGEFFTAKATSVAKAVEYLSIGAFRWDASQLGRTSTNHPVSVVKHCVLGAICDPLVEQVAATSEKEWTDAKARLLADARLCQDVVENLLGQHQALDVLAGIVSAYVTILRAALKDSEVSPKEVGCAKALVNDEVEALQLKTSLGKPGVGLCIVSDSDAVVLKGELDDQLDDDYRLHVQTMLPDGMPEEAEEGSNCVKCDVDLVSGSCSALALTKQSLEGYAIPFPSLPSHVPCFGYGKSYPSCHPIHETRLSTLLPAVTSPGSLAGE